MLALRGLAWLLALQSIGELLARGLHLPFPGPVVGMILLLLALRWPLVQAPVSACADFLLSHLSLLFVPVGVGVMTHLSLIGTYGVRILAALVLSTWIGLAVTAWVLHATRRRGGNAADAPRGTAAEAKPD
ncbi:MAG: CidA/LrgA family protein [Rhodoferax sp.]|nr:CidA/LrgA family protein [Rhodoferax sp.]